MFGGRPATPRVQSYAYTDPHKRIIAGMRRMQIHLDETIDDALAVEAARCGTSKAAIIRRALLKDLPRLPPDGDDPWEALNGWLNDGGVDDIDAAIYEGQP